MYRYVVIALSLSVLSSCSGGSRGSSEWPLEAIRITSSLIINPVSKTGQTSASVLVGEGTERPEEFLGSVVASDRLSGSDRITVSSDLVQANNYELFGSYRSTFDYGNLTSLNFGFFRDQQLGNSIDISINPSVIPKISVSPSVLDAASPTADISLSFEGLPDSFSLPEGARVGVGVYENVCEKNGEIVVDDRERRGIPDEIPIYSFGSIQWPFIIQQLNAQSLNQTIELFDFGGLTIVDGFQDDRYDSCSVVIRAGISYQFFVDELSDSSGFPELLNVQSNGDYPILYSHSVGIISEPVNLVLDKSLVTLYP